MWLVVTILDGTDTGTCPWCRRFYWQDSAGLDKEERGINSKLVAACLLIFLSMSLNLGNQQYCNEEHQTLGFNLNYCPKFSTLAVSTWNRLPLVLLVSLRHSCPPRKAQHRYLCVLPLKCHFWSAHRQRAYPWGHSSSPCSPWAPWALLIVGIWAPCVLPIPDFIAMWSCAWSDSDTGGRQ